MNADELKKHNEKTLRRAELMKAAPIKYEALEAVFLKWMLLPDPNVVKFITGFYCANRLPGKALWAFLIGPSGGGKTEILNSLLDLGDIESISMLTPNTFLSGMPGRSDASLLPKLNNKIALFKDWTSILSLQKDAKAELMSQFREIWDGSMKKIFGNGQTRTWEGKVSVLAASTQAVDLNQQQYTHLGERFLNYRLVTPDRKEVALRSLQNDAKQEQMGNEIRAAMFAFVKGVDFEKFIKEPPIMPKEYQPQIVNLANFCTMARSGIIRDFGMKKEVIFVPAAEMPTRISGQLSKLVSGLMMSNGGEFQEKDMEIVYKVALDSIPQTNKMVIKEMARADNQNTSEIATALGYPTDPIKMYLENLAMLKVCRRVKDGNGYRWTMEEEFAEIVRHYEGVEELTEEERTERKEESISEAEDLSEYGYTPDAPDALL